MKGRAILATGRVCGPDCRDTPAQDSAQNELRYTRRSCLAGATHFYS